MNFLLNLSRLLDLATVSTEVNTILKSWIGPIFIAIGGVGVVYVIVMVVQYVRSENDSKKAEMKSRFVNTIIGVISLLMIGTIAITVDWADLVTIFDYTADKGMIGLLK